MSSIAKRQKSRMAEFLEADAAAKETGSKEHEVWRHNAMRSRDMQDRDFAKAQEQVTGRLIDSMADQDRLARRLGIQFTTEE